jgi:hypothetical protein
MPAAPAPAEPEGALAEARSRLDALDHTLRAAQHRLGGGLDVRRVRTDLDHLRESLALLAESVAARVAADRAHEMVEIEDTPYDPEMWRGIDDEGIGCRHN